MYWEVSDMNIDPVMIQQTIVTALALGATAGLQDTAIQVVKDAYGTVRSFIQKKNQQVDLAIQEDNPTSEARQGVTIRSTRDSKLAPPNNESLTAVLDQHPCQ